MSDSGREWGENSDERIRQRNLARQKCREQFEQWISGEPFSKLIERYPNKPEKFAWPGSYVDINTELAWQAWKTAWEANR